MMTAERTLDLLRHLATRPGHTEVLADFRSLLGEEFGTATEAVRFEVHRAVIRGRIDALVGRTVFEAKRNLDDEIDDVVRRLPDYLADAEREWGQSFIGIASDGLKWAVFELREGALVKVKETRLDPDRPDAFLAWLDGALALKASLPPDALTIRAELGSDSIAFHLAREELRAAWARLADDPAQALKRQLWAELLKLVHGRDVDSDELWLQHSYLVIVAKCIALAVMDLGEDDPRRMLSGEAFADAGIEGAVESDFFDWMVADAPGRALVRRVMAHVRRFRLREAESDVLKILYESLIDRDERHGLGEYYTPDWLAAKVVRHAVTAPLEQRVLDPACGSGTFVFHAVRRVLAEAEEAGLPVSEHAAEATRWVAGMDIHPVAVILARVTFLLALAPVIGKRAGSLRVPVYLGDAMQLGITHNMTETHLVIRVPPPPAGAAPLQRRPGHEVLSFPETFCRDPALFDKAIERMRTATLEGLNRGQVESALLRITDMHIKELPADGWVRAARTKVPQLTDEHRRAVVDMGATYETFDRLRREGRDTIWAYVARNLSRPLSMSVGGGQINVLVGNPPWVAYRHMSADLQKRFKELAQGEKVYVGGRFATQNDLCALFTVRASHLYLRPSGRIAFVLPLATLTRGQFVKFREGRFGSYNIAWDEAWTMDDGVAPLFPVPSCAVFGRKRAIGKGMPDKVTAYRGHLPMRDAPEAVADARLTVAQRDAPAAGEVEGGSAYRNQFRQGAILVPRMLCLVERRRLGRLGSAQDRPAIESRRSSLEKEPWRSVASISGQVETRFLRPVLLGESILPYCLFQSFEGAIPYDDRAGLLTTSKIASLPEKISEGRSFEAITGWLRTAEQAWDENKSASTTLTFAEQLDFFGKLSAQFPIAPVRVIYSKAGSLPAAMVLRDGDAIIDHMLYTGPRPPVRMRRTTSSPSSTARPPDRAPNATSARAIRRAHFDKVMFNLPIPVFDPAVALHRDLAIAGQEAEQVASNVELVEGEKFQRARRRVREGLTENGVGPRIEKLVDILLGPA